MLRQSVYNNHLTPWTAGLVPFASNDPQLVELRKLFESDEANKSEQMKRTNNFDHWVLYCAVVCDQSIVGIINKVLPSESPPKRGGALAAIKRGHALVNTERAKVASARTM